jgi:hypothetical protein
LEKLATLGDSIRIIVCLEKLATFGGSIRIHVYLKKLGTFGDYIGIMFTWKILLLLVILLE